MRFRNSNPHFMQPLLPNFRQYFCIPKSFLRYIRDGARTEDDTTVALLRDRRGRIWGIKIEYINRQLQLKDGWDKFCEYHNLQVCDFVVFKHEGNLVFDVYIFDPSGCEREFLHSVDMPVDLASPSSNHPTNVMDNPPQPQARWQNKNICKQRDIGSKPTENPYCSLVIKPYHCEHCALYIPMDFARTVGLSKRYRVKLINEKGGAWLLPFRFNITKATAYIGRRQTFHTANGLNTGDNIVLEHVESGKDVALKVHSKVSFKNYKNSKDKDEETDTSNLIGGHQQKSNEMPRISLRLLS